MRTFITILIITLIVTILVVIGGVIFLSISGSDLEVKLGLSPDRDLDAESQLQGAPGRITNQALDIYSPIPQHVYYEDKVILEGKAKAKEVFVFINKDEQYLLKTDSENRFKMEITLKPGINQVYVHSSTSDGEMGKEIITAFYPELKGNTNTQFAYLGEIMQNTPENFEVGFGKDRLAFSIPSGTKILRNDSNVSLNSLEISERTGIIAIQEPDGKLKAVQIQADLYPYFIYGTVDQVTGNVMSIERKRAGGPKATVNFSSQTKPYIIKNTETLTASTVSDFPQKARVLASGYVIPKENRSTYFLYSIIKTSD